MKYLALIILLTVISLSVPQMAGAQQSERYSTAGSLESSCKVANSENSAERGTYFGGVCDGYIYGFLSVIWSGIDTTTGPNGEVYTWKIEDNVTVGQIQKVFLKYIAAHPEEENKIASGVLIDALVDSKLISTTLTKPKSTSAAAPIVGGKRS
jgi:hypothetical protein